MKFQNKQKGFIKYAVLIIAIVILVAYFREDIVKLLTNPAIKSALVTAIGWIKSALLWIVGRLNWLIGLLK